MQYKVYIQEVEVGDIEAENTGEALATVAKKIESGEYVMNNTKPRSIKVVPA
jgi:hypothetical protein